MKDFTQQQKVIKVGNSLAVTLDKKFVEAAEIEAGDQIASSYSETHVAFAPSHSSIPKLKDAGSAEYTPKKLTKTEKRAVVHSKVTPEFRQWVDEFLDENQEAMEKLANL